MRCRVHPLILPEIHLALHAALQQRTLNLEERPREEVSLRLGDKRLTWWPYLHPAGVGQEPKSSPLCGKLFESQRGHKIPLAATILRCRVHLTLRKSLFAQRTLNQEARPLEAAGFRGRPQLVRIVFNRPPLPERMSPQARAQQLRE